MFENSWKKLYFNEVPNSGYSGIFSFLKKKSN
jgi:hypothetical protein